MSSIEGKMSRVQVVLEKVNITTIFVVFDIKWICNASLRRYSIHPRGGGGGGGDFAYKRVEMLVGNLVPKGDQLWRSPLIMAWPRIC